MSEIFLSGAAVFKAIFMSQPTQREIINVIYFNSIKTAK
jgi:hypothetical protein